MTKEEDVSLTIPPSTREWFEKYSRPIGYVCVILFMLLLLFVGFAFGAAYICEGEMQGFLDDRFNCHLNLTTNTAEPLQPDPTIIQPELNYNGFNI